MPEPPDDEFTAEDRKVYQTFRLDIIYQADKMVHPNYSRQDYRRHLNHLTDFLEYELARVGGKRAIRRRKKSSRRSDT